MISGDGIFIARKILGHENGEITEIYLHSVGETEREAMRVFEDTLGKFQTNPDTEVG
jgi:hypothetical protein